MSATRALRSRFASLLLALALFFAMLFPAFADTPQSAAPVIQTQKDTLIVGSEQNFPPFATGMTDETAGGFTVDLWRIVAAEAGLKYRFRVRPFHQLLDEFRQGKIDVLINLAQTDERHQFADFTVPHVIVHGAVFVRKGTALGSVDDLAGKSIIVLNADMGHNYAISRGWGGQLVLVDTAAEGMRLLSSGRHDAMLLSKLAGMQTLQTLRITNIEALKTPAGFSQKFSFAVREGQSELLGRINEGLAICKTNGSYNALYEKWFGVYEQKEVGFRDMLIYLAPLILIFIGIAASLYHQRHTERAEAERKYRDLYDHSPDMLLSVEVATKTITDCNQTLLDAIGYTREDLVGRSVVELYCPDCADIVHAACLKLMSDGEVRGVELQLRRRDGSKIEVNLSATAVFDKKGVILYSRSSLRDITEQKLTSEKLRALYTAIEQSPISVIITDTDARIEYVNPNFTAVTGYNKEEVIGKNPNLLQSGHTPAGTYLALWEKLSSGQVWHGELINKRRNGEIYWEEAHISPILNNDGKTTHYVAAKIDITDRKAMEGKIQHLAHHDALTDLPNRTLFMDRLQHALSAARRDKTHIALMFIDLDKFKPINDTLGHDTGDAMLKLVSQRILACLRESDTVARMGGDEFVVLLPAIESVQDAVMVAEKIRLSLNLPFDINDNRLTISSSTGIAIYPEHGSDEKQLIRNADTAMYYAKTAGRNNVHIYQPDMRKMT